MFSHYILCLFKNLHKSNNTESLALVDPQRNSIRIKKKKQIKENILMTKQHNII